MLRALWQRVVAGLRRFGRPAPPRTDGLAAPAAVSAAARATASDSAAVPRGLVPLRVVRWRRWRGWLAERTRLFTNTAIGVGLTLFAGLALLVQAGLTHSFDLAVTQGIQAVQHPLFASLMVGVSQFGFMPLGFWIVVLTSLALWRAHRPLEASLVLAGGAGGMLAETGKVLLMRPRPSAEQVRVATELAGHSFPSGHTLMYVGFFGFLCYLAYARLRPGPPRTAALVVCGTLVALVGASRVYLGQHWPTDVLASYLLGLAYLLVLVRVYLWRKLAAVAAAPA